MYAYFKDNLNKILDSFVTINNEKEFMAFSNKAKVVNYFCGKIKLFEEC